MAKKLDSISSFVSSLNDTLASIVKVIILSKWNTRSAVVASTEELVILGNGPSLNDTLAQSPKFLESKRLLAVNFAANTDVFFSLKPEYYVIADPHFFNISGNDNVKKMWERLSTMVDWNMTLFIPATAVKKGKMMELTTNSHITLETYNTTPVEGFNRFENIIYSSGLGMPRPRNVLIPSIMIALRMKFKNIYIAGADHSWSRTLSVNDDNRVVSIQPHFYKENEAEKKRVDTEYMNYPLHTIMYSFYVAFKSYFKIERYATHIGAKIWNITPGSFIDAFSRKTVTDSNK